MNDQDLLEGVAHLRAADPAMARVIDIVGPPAIRRDDPEPFRAITRAIVFQQLSGKAATTIHTRYLALFDCEPGGDTYPTPAQILAAEDEVLRSAGLSRQKVASIRDLALHVAEGRIDHAAFDAMDDEQIITELTRVRGVGRWTAEMYLIFNLGRPDVLPVNDLGINRGIMQLYGLEAMPKPDKVREVGTAWRPWATIACWYMWRAGEIVLPVD